MKYVFMRESTIICLIRRPKVDAGRQPVKPVPTGRAGLGGAKRRPSDAGGGSRP
jgi:hypothetical protein